MDGVKYAGRVEMSLGFGFNRMLGWNENENEKPEAEAEEIEHEDPRMTLKKKYDPLKMPFRGMDGTVVYSYQLNMGKLGDATILDVIQGITDFQKRPTTNILNERNPSISITRKLVRNPVPDATVTSGEQVNQFASMLTSLKDFLIANTENNVFNKNATLASLLPAPPSRAPVTPRGRGGRRTKRAKRAKRHHTKRAKRSKHTRRRKH